MVKFYAEAFNVGSAKYVVSFYDGVKTHRDGSRFYDVRIFRNKRVKALFIKGLIKAGYRQGDR